MYVKSKVAVTYNDGIKSQASAIVEGHILSSAWTNGEYNQLGFNFAYTSVADEEGNRTVLVKDGFTVDGDTIEQLYQAVKDSVPTDLTYAETQQYLHYLGFIQEMATTFEIAPSDIEIVL